ncbi:hypothetical protein MNBD_ALPHA08-2218 [hydrothermal vent metagenome]|uniref:Rieske domain-containing protein n=1 Tax=hydrothermal vent metagenome TaxID=652676 RepID=A0A3B0RLX5_9ZZZZ
MTKSTVYKNTPTRKELAKQVGHKCLVSRRNFLIGTGATTATVMVVLNPGTADAQKIPGRIATYPRKMIGKISQLKQDKPLDFSYPDEGDYSDCMVVKLGVESGGGVGKAKDIVAYNYACTHQGSSLAGSYKAETKSLGACPLHLSTYDLTRHGILISGQAYQSLPQILLEVEGDKIYATGVFGLIFGRENNLQS